MGLIDKWNKNNFSIYTSEEKTSLKLIENINKFLGDDVIKEVDNKTDLRGNHLGQWQGLNKPTLSEEGMRATVEKIDNEFKDIKTNGIVVSDSLQNAIVQAPNYSNKVILTKDIIEDFIPYTGLTIESPSNSSITLSKKINLSEVNNLTFRNIRFVGTEIFDLIRCHNIKFINCKFNSSDMTIIKMQNCYYSLFEDCSFYGSTGNYITNSSVGIYGIVVNACNFIKCSFFNIRNMIILEDTQSANILNGNFEHIGEKGIYLKSTGNGYWNTTTANVQINGCRFETAYNTNGNPPYVEDLTHYVYINENSHNNIVENNFMQTYNADYEVVNKTVMNKGYNNKIENNSNFREISEIKEKIYEVINYNTNGLVYDSTTNIPLAFYPSSTKYTFSRYGLKTKFTTEGSEYNINHTIKNVFVAFYDTPVLIYLNGTFKGKFTLVLRNETDSLNIFSKSFTFKDMTRLDRCFYGTSFVVSKGKKYSIMLSKSTEHTDVDYPIFEGIIDDIMVINTNTPSSFNKLRENKIILVDETIIPDNVVSYFGYEVIDNIKSYKTNFNNKLV